MPKAYFTRDGKRCPANAKALSRLPDCAPHLEQRAFEPHGATPPPTPPPPPKPPKPPPRLRHCLRRYKTFTERRARGEVELGFVPDPENPTDFMTKWVSAAKLEASLEYLCNTRNAVRHERDVGT